MLTVFLYEKKKFSLNDIYNISIVIFFFGCFIDAILQIRKIIFVMKVSLELIMDSVNQ